MQERQLPLFPDEPAQGGRTPPIAVGPELGPDSSLASAIGGYHEHMIRRGFSKYTIRSYRSDLRLLSRYVGANKPIGEINTRTLEDFLTWLVHYRGVPCSPKSYHRRLTALKAFFSWLAEAGVIPSDPAAPIPQERPASPLPTFLYEDQVERLLEVTRRRMEDPERPDPRPHLLVTLLLHTGIKKGECVGIALDHIDLSDPAGPCVYIRYSNPKMRHKERKLRLPPDFPELLARYRAKYQPKERLFECTARNLEYVLSDVAREAGVEGVSFEALRWTCAVRDFRTGMPPDKLRQKLGLSKITWAETGERLRQLASPPL
jgi:integrase/recombinase XerD